MIKTNFGFIRLVSVKNVKAYRTFFECLIIKPVLCQDTQAAFYIVNGTF
jgi:hypothetical protein